MAEKCAFIALDAGTHAIRACVFFLSGPTALWRMSEVFSCDIPLNSTKPRHVEQNPKEIVQALQHVYLQAHAFIAQQGLYSPSMVSVGIAVQRSSVLAWQRNTGDPLSPVLSWQDTRCFEAIDNLTPADCDLIKQLTGLRPSPHYGASKLFFLQEQLSLHEQKRDGQQYSDQAIMGPLAAWLIKQLTGNNYCDPVNAARTLLFNRQKAQWDNALCTIFKITHAQLPAIQKSIDQYGDIQWSNDEQLSPQMPTNAQLIAALGDQNAAYIAMRYSHPPDNFLAANPLVINIGSGAFVLGPCDKQNDSSTLGLLTGLAFSHGDTEEWLMEGTVNSAGTALSLWRENLPTALSEESLFAQLPQWLSDDQWSGDDKHTEKDSDIFYLNTAVGIGSPFWLHRFAPASNVFINGDGNACNPTLEQQAVAIINSIAFLVVANILQFQKSSNIRHYDGVIATGGLSRVDGLIERIADLCGLPILVTTCHEATLQGVAMLGSNFRYKPRIEGHIVAAKKTSTVLLKRYQRYIQLIQMKACKE